MKKSNMTSDILTARQLAGRLNLSLNTVKGWPESVPRVRVSSRAYRYREDDVLRYWENAPPVNESREEREARYAANGESAEERDVRHATEKENVERLFAQIYASAGEPESQLPKREQERRFLIRKACQESGVADRADKYISNGLSYNQVVRRLTQDDAITLDHVSDAGLVAALATPITSSRRRRHEERIGDAV